MTDRSNTVIIDEFKVYRILKKHGIKKGRLSELFGITRQGILWRFDNGWPPEDAHRLADLLSVSLSELKY